MSSVSIWNLPGKSTGRLRRARTAKNRTSGLNRRSSVERLENRRLFVADLINYLTTEHVDINVGYSGSQWSVGPRNSDLVPAIQYANDEAVMYVGSPAQLARPAGTAFDFIGVPAGQPFYLLPQSQDPEVLYLGFAGYGLDNSIDRYNPVTESKGRASGSARWSKLTLDEVRHFSADGTPGTGQFSLWQTGTFGQTNVFMSSYNDGVANPNSSGLDTTDGITSDDAIWNLVGGHAHYNFGFSAPGRYEVDVKASAYFGDDNLTTPNTAGFNGSEEITLYFSVMSVGQLQLEQSSYAVNENAGTATIDVVRAGGSDGRIAVNYTTANGTALAGNDYALTTGTLEFLDGEKRKTITVPIQDDPTVEGDEAFTVQISAPMPANIHEYVRDSEGDINGLLGSVTTATVTILDNDGNTPPTISNVTDQATSEDTPTSAIAFTVGDLQTAAGSLVVTASSSNSTLVPVSNIVLGGSGANRTVTITPAANLVGASTITLTVTDEGGLTATDTFLLTVSTANNSPTANDDRLRVSAGGKLSGNVLFNDFDSDSDTLTVAIQTQPLLGSLVLLPNGAFTYTPSNDFGGVDSFTYKVMDSSGAEETASVTIELSKPFLGTAMLDRDHIDLGIGFEDNSFDLHLHDEDAEVEYDPREAALVVGEAALANRAMGSEFDFIGVAAGQPIYVLPQVEDVELPFLGVGAEEIGSGVFQSDSIELRLKSVAGPGQFSLWQSGVNTPTVSMASADGISESDRVLVIAGGHQHFNWGFTQPGTYQVAFETIAILPNGVEVRSGDTVYTFIVNSDPTAVNDSYTVIEEQQLTVNAIQGLLANDFDPDGQAVVPAIVSKPANGTVSLNADGSFSYTPNANFSGTDTFTYAVTDMRYRLVPIGTLGGLSSFGLDVNNDRQATGNSSVTVNSSNPLQAFIWEDGVMVGLGVLPGTGSNNFSRGYALNDLGVVVGESDNSISKAFRWDNGTLTNLGALGGTSSVAHDVNNLGVVVGSSNNGTASKPFVLTSSGMTALPTLSALATATGRAWAISSDGKYIAGLSRATDASTTSHATLWELQADGSYAATDIGALVDESFFSQAYAVNSAGVAVGYSVVGTVSSTSTTSLNHGFYRLDDGELVDIGILSDRATWRHSEARDVNNAGNFVGSVANFFQSPTFGGAAFLGDRVGDSTAIVELNELVVNGAGWQLQAAEGINQARDIIGYGTQVVGGTNRTRAFILVPETVDTDGRVFTNVATVTINVQGTPDAPIAVDDNFTVTLPKPNGVDTTNSIYSNVTQNDYDPDQGTQGLNVSLVTPPQHGTLTLNSNGTFTYVPSSTFATSDTFTYRVSDGSLQSGIATATITAATSPTFLATLTTGHADIGMALGLPPDDGHGHAADPNSIELHIHNHEDEAEYAPDEALLYVGSAGVNIRQGDTSSTQYDFLGVEVGKSFYVLPAVQNTDLLFLGIGGEEIQSGLLEGDVAALQLKSVDGPGHFAVWQSSASSPTVKMSTADGINVSDVLTVTAGSHSHYNMAFSKPGRYAITFVAQGIVDSDGALLTDEATYYFQVGNTIDSSGVQNGQSQRSFVRNVDLVFGEQDNLAALLTAGRVQVTKFDLNGSNPTALAASAYSASVDGDRLRLDFGAQGIGGNRNTNAGDGYYRIGVDLDGDGTADVYQHFYRLLGDMNGDRKVDAADRAWVMSGLGTTDPERDVNGDGVVNSVDNSLVMRAIGKKLKDGLWVDD